jgi:3-hydroxyisobutyrate dehydrogenase-like beta-hydroxyacid dehydrogenase
MSTDRVGFVGLGNIGAPIAEHLLDWPGGLVVCDVREAATEPFAARGATVVDDPSGMAKEGARLISVMVLDDHQVREVVEAVLSTAEAGTIVAVHSTIRPETAEELADEAATRGVAILDAPVSGGAMGAQQGSLAVMVGGDRDAYERCRRPFATFADLVLHFGPAGSGTRAKIARNLLTFVSYAAAGEAQRLAESAGVDLRKLAGVVRHSDAITGGPGAIMLRATTEPLPPDDGLYDILCHTRSLGEKDLALALELAVELGVDLPLTTTASRRLADALGVPHDGAPADGPIDDAATDDAPKDKES